MQTRFIAAMQSKQKIRLTFYSKEDHRFSQSKFLTKSSIQQSSSLGTQTNLRGLSQETGVNTHDLFAQPKALILG